MIPYPEMVFVEGGTFMMGCLNPDTTQCTKAELPAHKIRLHNFFIDKYPVTVKEFRKFILSSGYKTTAGQRGLSEAVLTPEISKDIKGIDWEYDSYGNKLDSSMDNFPVVHVSWYDANAYCTWLTKTTGKKFRLPTEAEWEYSARGGNKSKGYRLSGGKNPLDIGWFNVNSGNREHTVGQKLPNELGLYDMSGNVWEWVNDRFSLEYYGASPPYNPQGPIDGDSRVIRGGSWINSPVGSSVYRRVQNLPNDTKGIIGFRIAADSLELSDKPTKITVSDQDTMTDDEVQKIALQIPAKFSETAQGIADYFVSKFSLQTQRARAIYLWVVYNIDYDVEKLNEMMKDSNIQSSSIQNLDADLTLKSRKGVCWDYACLFSDIANKAGLNTMIVEGITSDHTYLSHIGHAWCATEIDSKWYLMDPTWGAGWIKQFYQSNRNKFVRHINLEYFMASPLALIKTHMPYDCMWEFIDFPFVWNEDQSGKFVIKRHIKYFNYSDSLRVYINKSPLGRLITSFRRANNDKLTDSAVISYLSVTMHLIAYEHYTSSGKLCKTGWKYLNDYIETKQRNHQLNKSQPEMQKKLDVVGKILGESEDELERIDKIKVKRSLIPLNSEMISAIQNLQTQIENQKTPLAKEQEDLDDYYKVKN